MPIPYYESLFYLYICKMTSMLADCLNNPFLFKYFRLSKFLRFFFFFVLRGIV